MSLPEITFMFSLLARAGLPVLAVMLYAAALASAAYMLRDRGNNGH